MWKNYLKLFIILLCVIAVDGVQVKAYTVKVQADTIYAEVVPESYLKNAPVVFKNAVKKTMKYYDKYKDADMVTYLRNVPKTYRDFVDIARKIRDSDEITLYSLQCAYIVTLNEEDENAPPTFTFLAERNGKLLCDFGICIDNNTKKFTFIYDNDESFKYDRKIMYNALFYTLGEKSYYETPEKTVCIVDNELPEGAMVKMESDGVDWEAILKKKYKEFQKLTYEEKKNEIFNRLRNFQKGKTVKQAEKNMKLELKDDSSGAESDIKASNSGKLYRIIGIICVVAIVAGIFLARKRRREQ